MKVYLRNNNRMELTSGYSGNNYGILESKSKMEKKDDSMEDIVPKIIKNWLFEIANKCDL